MCETKKYSWRNNDLDIIALSLDCLGVDFQKNLNYVKAGGATFHKRVLENYDQIRDDRTKVVGDLFYPRDVPLRENILPYIPPLLPIAALIYDFFRGR